MDKVITINNWWDGPLCGLATFDGLVCAYDRIFDKEKDDYSDEYRLIAVSREDELRLLSEWSEWCDAVSNDDTDMYYKKHDRKGIEQLFAECDPGKIVRKKARFSGRKKYGFIPDGYFVEWYD